MSRGCSSHRHSLLLLLKYQWSFDKEEKKLEILKLQKKLCKVHKHFDKRMNARSQIFELSVEGRQIEEVVQSVFHSLLLHRTLGKFHYKQEGSYSIGTVGFMDVDCDYIDFTYVRVASDELDQNLRREVSMFRDTLRSHDGPRSGQISLEFYQKKRARWPFQSECIPWEVWTVKLDIITLANEHERQVCREKLGEMLAEKVMYVAETMNRHEYVPKMPNQSDLDLIFDTMYPDVQPYLYRIKGLMYPLCHSVYEDTKGTSDRIPLVATVLLAVLISHQTTGPASASVGTTMRKFIKDTLAL